MEGEELVGGSTPCCGMATHLEHLWFSISNAKKTCEIVMKGHEIVIVVFIFDF